MKVRHPGSHTPPQIPTDDYGKFNKIKAVLEDVLEFLQISKGDIRLDLREKIPLYEKKIIMIINTGKSLPVQAPAGHQQFHQSDGQAPSSDTSQQHQSSQGVQEQDNHTNQMPRASFSGMSTGLQS